MTWPAVFDLIRLRNQTGTLLLMFPTLWALVLASHGQPPPHLLAIFAVGSFLMRSAGVAMNDLADRSFDRQVERTKTRPLAMGQLTVATAVGVVAILLSLAASLLVFLNTLTRTLSPVAVLLAALYPFSKRVLHTPQAILGIAFGWGVVMAWAAVRNTLDQPVWFLFGATVFWALAYDTIYALQDLEDDKKIGVKSSAILFGSWTWLAVGSFSGVMLACLTLCGWLAGLNSAFYLVLAALAVILGRQVWELRRPVAPPRALALFKQHAGIGVTVLLGFWIGFL